MNQREIPELAPLARSGKVRVIAFVLQRPGETAAVPTVIQAAPLPLGNLHGPSQPGGLLARFGDRIGALPYTVILDQNRRPCARQVGEINHHWLGDRLAACRQGTS